MRGEQNFPTLKAKVVVSFAAVFGVVTQRRCCVTSHKTAAAKETTWELTQPISYVGMSNEPNYPGPTIIRDDVCPSKKVVDKGTA